MKAAQATQNYYHYKMKELNKIPTKNSKYHPQESQHSYLNLKKWKVNQKNEALNCIESFI